MGWRNLSKTEEKRSSSPHTMGVLAMESCIFCGRRNHTLHMYSGLCKKKDLIGICIPTLVVPCAKALFPNWNSLGMEESSLRHAVTTSCSPINESHDGLPRARHYEFISWKPVHLKSPIGFNHPILLIKVIRCMDFHHPQPANTGFGMLMMCRALK